MIHVLTGPPCGGKSTYIAKHAKKDELRVDYDEMAMTFGGKEKWNPVGIVQKATMKAREAAIQVALKNQDAESWIIQSRLSDEMRKTYEDAGAEIIELDPGKEECLARAKRDERPHNIILAIEGWYKGKGEKGKMERKYKDFTVRYKDEGQGTIEGYASTWIRKADSYGDVIREGAFKKTLAERWNGGKGIPFIWAHRMDDLNAFIGTAEADEDEKGLHFIATFDDTPEAQKVRQLFKDGRLSKFSFAYDVKEQGITTLEDGMKANELRELDLFEISAVAVPANDDSSIVDVKSGRRNSRKDEDKLKEAISLLGDLQGILKQLIEEDEGGGEDNPEGNGGKPEDLKGRNPKADNLLKYIKENLI